MIRYLTAICGVLLLNCTGCILLRGDSQKVTFQTEPTGAAMTVDGKEYTAPAEVALKRNKPHEITAKSDGYRAIEFKLESRFDGLSLLDIALPGGSIALATDTVTGADKSFTQVVKITLPKADSADTAPVVLHELNGKLLTEDEYHTAIAKLDADMQAAHFKERRSPVE